MHVTVSDPVASTTVRGTPMHKIWLALTAEIFLSFTLSCHSKAADNQADKKTDTLPGTLLFSTFIF